MGGVGLTAWAGSLAFHLERIYGPLLTVLATDVLHGPGSPELDPRGVEALQQREEGIERSIGQDGAK